MHDKDGNYFSETEKGPEGGLHLLQGAVDLGSYCIDRNLQFSGYLLIGHPFLPAEPKDESTTFRKATDGGRQFLTKLLILQPFLGRIIG